MKETPAASDATIEASATRLQQSCDEMTASLADLSESMTEVADGFANLSAVTNDASREPTAARSTGFGAADD